MAPDESQLRGNGSMAPDGYSNGYQIPNITLKAPENRRIKVLTIGAGVSGIMIAYKIQNNARSSYIPFPVPRPKVMSLELKY